MKITNISIENYKIFSNFQLNFNKDSAPLPLIVIAGINGSGKTTLLEFIHNFFQEKIFNNFNSINISASNIFGNQPSFDSDIRLTNEFLLENKNKFKYKLSDKIIYYKAGVIENTTAKQVITEYIDRIIYENDVPSSVAYKTLQEKLNSFLENFDLQVQFNQLDRKKEIYFKNNVSDKILIDDLSGGEKELITKLLPLYLSEINESVILVDEPESSLHPNWQFEIAGLYQKIAAEKNCQIILTTHSPHIVASVPKHQIKVLVKEDNQIKVIENFTKSYGKRIDEVLLEIFRINGLRTPIIEEKLTRCKKLLFANQYESNEFLKLLAELEEVIGEDDNDLVLTRLELSKRNKEFAKTESYKKRSSLL